MAFGGSAATVRSLCFSRSAGDGRNATATRRTLALALLLLAVSPAVAPEPAAATEAAKSSGPAAPAPAAGDATTMTMETFLDRLMQAESGGRLTARNPRSTALGPFQFIESTFLAVARRYFAGETGTLTVPQILALRTDLAFSRRAAEAYTKENAAVLQSAGIAPTFPHLRLAFLLGAAGAVRVLEAPPDMPLSRLLGPAVLMANPFMLTLTARGLAQRSAREIAQPVTSTLGVALPPGTILPKRPSRPAVAVRCNLKLAGCRRWVALQTAKVRGRKAAIRTAAVTGNGKKGSGSAARLAQPRR
jgi:hypothetical protein